MSSSFFGEGSRNTPDIASLKALLPGIPILFLIFLIAYALWTGFYIVKPHEEAVVLRFGKFHKTESPGLHFKLPFVDKAEKVLVYEQSMRLPWGIDSEAASQGMMSSSVNTRRSRTESLILTGDLYAAVVEWNVVWRVAEPKDYLFSIQSGQVRDVITAVALSTMHQIVGDYSATEILTGKREEAGVTALNLMKEVLASYECGVEIVNLQMQRVTPPERVKPSFDGVNESIQDRDKLVSNATEERNKLIPMAQASRDRLIREAEGYAARRKAEAAGEIAALLAKFHAYEKAPKITRQRMYLETMERVIRQSGPKTVLDGQLGGILPLLNLDNELTSSESNR